MVESDGAAGWTVRKRDGWLVLGGIAAIAVALVLAGAIRIYSDAVVGYSGLFILLSYPTLGAWGSLLVGSGAARAPIAKIFMRVVIVSGFTGLLATIGAAVLVFTSLQITASTAVAAFACTVPPLAAGVAAALAGNAYRDDDRRADESAHDPPAKLGLVLPAAFAATLLVGVTIVTRMSTPATIYEEAIAPLEAPDFIYPTGDQVTRRPSADEMAAAYPASALESGIEGRVLVQCAATINGALNACSAIEEDPGGLDFGRAAERLAQDSVRVDPALAHSEVRFNIRFAIGADAPTPAPLTNRPAPPATPSQDVVADRPVFASTTQPNAGCARIFVQPDPYENIYFLANNCAYDIIATYCFVANFQAEDEGAYFCSVPTYASYGPRVMWNPTRADKPAWARLHSEGSESDPSRHRLPAGSTTSTNEYADRSASGGNLSTRIFVSYCRFDAYQAGRCYPDPREAWRAMGAPTTPY